MSLANANANGGASARKANLWLAIGDETGSFKGLLSPDFRGADFHGAALIIARPEALTKALDEKLAGESIRERMNRAIGGLEHHLNAKGPKKKKELKRHHVMEAWSYFKECGVQGQYQLTETPSDPVLANLIASIRWLAAHPNILSVGVHGSGKEVLSDFWKGSDPMAAIGALYGRTLALVSPFLGPSPRIRVLPGIRSEEVDSAVILSEPSTSPFVRP